MPMNIYTGTGQSIRFAYPYNGTKYDQDHAKEHLRHGIIYTVEKTTVDRCYSEVELRELPGIKFNTVMFDNVFPLADVSDEKYEDILKRAQDATDVLSSIVKELRLRPNTVTPEQVLVDQRIRETMFWIKECVKAKQKADKNA